ncbi:MAG: dihydroorotate dehydrogenase [Pseudomonadota bacterium]
MAKQRPEHADEEALEAFFASARRAAPIPSGKVMARIAAAGEAQAHASASLPTSSEAAGPMQALIARAFATIGGWAGAAGLSAAAAAGVYIGLASPEILAGLLPVDTVSSDALLPSYEALLVDL